MSQRDGKPRPILHYSTPRPPRPGIGFRRLVSGALVFTGIVFALLAILWPAQREFWAIALSFVLVGAVIWFPYTG